MNSLKICLVTVIFLTGFCHNSSFPQELNWQSIGPTGGNVSYLVTAPSDSNIVYATIRDGSIFKSIDAGQNWEFKYWHDGYVASIDVHPNNPEVIYVIFSGKSGRIIIKSTDSGESWNVPPWNFNYIINIAIDNLNPDRMYVADFEGFFRTSDGGNQWYLNDSIYLSSVHVAPNTSNILFGFSNEWKFYRSINYGETWNMVSNLEGNPLWLEIDPINNSILYIATSWGLFKSFNGGSSWIKKDDGEINTQHPWTSYVIIDPSDNSKLFRSNNHEWTTFMSTNSGNYWEKIDLISGALSISGTDRLLSGTRDGIYSSSLDGQDTSYSSNGLNAVSIQNIIVDENDPYSLYASYWDQGILISYLYQYLGSGLWQKNYFDLGIKGLAMHPTNSDILSAGLGLILDGIKISLDGGNTWEVRGPNDKINFIKFSSIDSLKFYALGSDNLHYSTNLGFDWQIIPTPQFTHSFAHISTSVDENTILLSGDKGYDWNRRKILLISWDGGVYWEEKDILSEVGFIFPDSSEIMLAGTKSALYRSTNNGVTWTVLSYPENVLVRTFQKLEYNGVVMGTSKGLFYSQDMGKSWGEISYNLPHKHITSLAYSKYPEKILYAGTISGSVYYANVDTITHINEKPLLKKFFLSHNYPNPFNPTTKIKYQIPEISFITLRVYDVLGNEIATLVNEEKPAGSYEVEWNASDFPSGVYFYQLTTGEFVETKKMVYLK